MPNLSGIPSPMNHNVSWNNPPFFDPATKRENTGAPGWNPTSTTPPSQSHGMPPPIPEGDFPFDAALSAHTQSPVWSPSGPPQIARATSFESAPLYANQMHQPPRRMTVPTPSEVYYNNPYNSPPSIPENQPVPTSPGAYGMGPLSLNHYASFGSFIDQPEVLSPPYTTTPPGIPADQAMMQSEMSQQTHWLDPNMQYGTASAYNHHSPPL
ncbi:hypothetical protein KEM56_002597 [Ascosphaera pollenicola]|nr:hypothetical protein KEM56_002597 [Ascosphaera pollenicola]